MRTAINLVVSSLTKEIEEFKGSYFFIVQGKKMDNSELFDIFLTKKKRKRTSLNV